MVQIVSRHAQAPNSPERSVYYAVVFLNQLRFEPQDAALAAQLLELYVGLFRAHVSSKDEAMNERLLGAILSSMHRALPFAPRDAAGALVQHCDSLFRMVHTGTWGEYCFT